MNPLKFSRLLWTALLASIALATSATAQTFSFAFNNGGGVTALGTVNVVAGVATTGQIGVTGTPTLDATYHLVSPVPSSGSVRDSLGGGGDDMIFDNAVHSSETFLTTDGLGFALGYDGAGHVQAFANLWENSPGSYELYVAGNLGSGYGYDLYTGPGSLTQIPEPSSWALLVGCAAFLFVAVGRRFRSRAAV